MKIWEVKNIIKEEVDQEVLQKLKNAIRVYSQVVSTQQTSTGSSQSQSQSNSSRPNRINRLISQIKSGEHDVSKKLDELIKTGSERQIRSFVINTGNTLGEEILNSLDIKSSARRRAISRTVDMRVTAALTGYANKKYLGGSADNFNVGKGFWGKVKQAVGGNQSSPAQNTQSNQQSQIRQQQNSQQNTPDF